MMDRRCILYYRVIIVLQADFSLLCDWCSTRKTGGISVFGVESVIVGEISIRQT